jgi:hypothetical protein
VGDDDQVFSSSDGIIFSIVGSSVSEVDNFSGEIRVISFLSVFSGWNDTFFSGN